MKPLVTLVTIAAILPAIAGAEVVFEGELDGPTVGSDSPSTGDATLVLNDAQTEVAFEITYSNLVGDEIAAHFHVAPPGSFGPIVHELPPGTPKVGVWEIPPQLVQQLLDGNIYVVIHSDAYPAGEIGGWVAAIAVSADATSLTAIRGLFGEGAR